MLLYKWCRVLMRMMSPPAVGLICVLLIGVSSSTSLHSHIARENFPTNPILNAENKFKNHSSFAKEHYFHRTNLPTDPSGSVGKNFSSSRSIFRNSRKENGSKSRTFPSLDLSTKFHVRNGSDANSTVVFVPRYSRAMANFSQSSTDGKLLPVIVSSNRRNLLDIQRHEIRLRSDTKHVSKRNNSPLFESSAKKRDLLRYTTTSKPRKAYLKFRNSSSSSSLKTERPDRFLKTPNLSKKVSSLQKPITESSIFIKTKNENKNSAYSNKNSSIPYTLPFIRHRNFQEKKSLQNRRQGRNFDLNRYFRSSEEQERSPNFGNLSNSHENDFGKNASQHSIIESEKTEFLPTSVIIPSSDLGATYTERKSKNLTIYEILKPRLKHDEILKTRVPTIIDEKSGTSTNETAIVSETAIENLSAEEGVESTSFYLNASTSNILDAEKSENISIVTNGIENETPPFLNSMVILPSRSDSSYAVEYVIVNRNDSGFVSILNRTSVDSNKNIEFDKKITNVSQPNLNEQEIRLKPNFESDSILIQNATGEPSSSVKDLLRLKSEETNVTMNPHKVEPSTVSNNSSAENEDYDDSKYMTLLYESDYIRKPKMSEIISPENTPFKNPRLDSKMFYDYFAKKPIGNSTLREFPYPEFRPGNMFRYSDIYQRKPILDVAYTRATPFFSLTTTEVPIVTEQSVARPTTFNSLRTSVRVLSTFFPNRMQDVTMKFGNRIESTTPTSANDKNPEFRNEDDFDDAEYRDAIDSGFTMEKLAYLLIGTCCGLSILCLFVVVIAIKCRRAIMEKRLKAQFRKRMYYHEKMKDIATPWQQQMFDHFMYLHRRPVNSSCSSATESCNCRCVTWSLGARNLDSSTKPLCSTADRSSLYLQKKLPFGAASTLRYESMLGRKRTSPEANQQKATESPNTDSSHENDSLDMDSDSKEGDEPKQCTCIDYNIWPIMPSNVPRGFFTICPGAGRHNMGDCSQHAPVEMRTIARDVPPPVTGSNYLDRSEGVVYWSSNEERLI